jgi:hypothetical protein
VRICNTSKRSHRDGGGGTLAFASTLKFIYHIPLSHYHFRQPPSQSPHFFPTRDMANQSGSAHFQVLFESALQGYGKRWASHLPNIPSLCNSRVAIESVTGFQGEAYAFSTFQENDRIVKSVKTTVSKLTTNYHGVPRRYLRPGTSERADGSSTSQIAFSENSTCESITCYSCYHP